MQVIRIANAFYSSNTYLLSEEEHNCVWLVDCGDYSTKVRPLLNGHEIKGVFLSHTHSDHIYGLEDVLEDFPNIKIYTNEFGCEALGNSKLNLSKYHTEVPDLSIDCKDNVVVVDERVEMKLFKNISVKVLSTPGHDKSCLSYIVGENLFTGDSYIPGVKPTALFPNSSRKDAVASYERLLEISNRYCVCPGHGSITNRVECPPLRSR